MYNIRHLRYRVPNVQNDDCKAQMQYTQWYVLNLFGTSKKKKKIVEWWILLKRYTFNWIEEDFNWNEQWAMSDEYRVQSKLSASKFVVFGFCCAAFYASINKNLCGHQPKNGVRQKHTSWRCAGLWILMVIYN